MTYRRSIQQVLLLTVLTIAIFLYATLNVLAEDAGNKSNNQDLSKSAMLVAPEKNFQIDVYAQPNAMQQKRTGYGLSGDRVKLLQQIGSNTGKTWNLVRFENPPYAEGWISEEYLSIQNANKPSQKEGHNGYFGSQKKKKVGAIKSLSNQKSDYANNQNQNQ